MASPGARSEVWGFDSLHQTQSLHHAGARSEGARTAGSSPALFEASAERAKHEDYYNVFWLLNSTYAHPMAEERPLSPMQRARTLPALAARAPSAAGPAAVRGAARDFPGTAGRHGDAGHPSSLSRGGPGPANAIRYGGAPAFHPGALAPDPDSAHAPDPDGIRAPRPGVRAPDYGGAPAIRYGGAPASRPGGIRAPDLGSAPAIRYGSAQAPGPGGAPYPGGALAPGSGGAPYPGGALAPRPGARAPYPGGVPDSGGIPAQDPGSAPAIRYGGAPAPRPGAPALRPGAIRAPRLGAPAPDHGEPAPSAAPGERRMPTDLVLRQTGAAAENLAGFNQQPIPDAFPPPAESGTGFPARYGPGALNGDGRDTRSGPGIEESDIRRLSDVIYEEIERKMKREMERRGEFT